MYVSQNTLIKTSAFPDGPSIHIYAFSFRKIARFTHVRATKHGI